MSQSKLQAAKELLQEKNYTAARAILETLPGDPTAQRWLAKLNEIAPIQRQNLKPMRSLSTSERVIKAAEVKPRRRGVHPLVTLLIIVAVIIGVILVFSRIQQQQRWESQRTEASVALKVMCEIYLYGFNTVICGQWSERTLNEDLSNVDDILFCDRMYNINIESGLGGTYSAQSFFDCLARRGIYAP